MESERISFLTMVALTQELLIDAGGWQAMREARALHESGRVAEAVYDPPLLRGRVGEVRCGLRILSKTEMENLCSCLESRRGLICAHSLAVGLEVLKPAQRNQQMPQNRPAAPPPKSEAPPLPLYAGQGMPEVELHVILPPNFAASWQRGQITAAVEAAWAGSRKPLASLPANRRWSAEAADVVLTEALLRLGGGRLLSALNLDREQFSTLLDALTGHPRLSFGRKDVALVREEGLRPHLHLEMQADGALRLATRPWPSGELLLGKDAAWLLVTGEFVAIAPGLPAAYFPVLSNSVTIPAEGVAGFIQRELPMLSGPFDLTGLEALPEIPVPQMRAEIPVHMVLEGSLNALVAKIHAPLPPSSHVLTELQTAGFAGPDRNGEWMLKGEAKILSFFAAQLSRWQQRWHVEVGERFQHVTRQVERLEPKLEIRSSGERWFDLSAELVTASGDRVSSAEVQQLLQAGQNFLKRRGGKVVVFNPDQLDDFSQLLRDSQPEQRSPGIYRLDRRQAGALRLFSKECGIPVQGDSAWRQWTPEESLAELPSTLGEALRDYQKHGAAWMRFLAQNGFGGILADEMGLGKTLQALTFLRTLHGSGPSLVICPSTLLFNWEAEAARWAPELRVLRLDGPRRIQRFGDIQAANLVLTSYPLLRLDVDSLRREKFAAVILDEAQNIKNPDSQVARAASALQAAHRFALTGTPVENSVRDLWSVMHFLMPGYLGSRKDFHERFAAPISGQPSGPEQQRLARRVRPFLLRRTKAQVAAELPRKLDQVLWCELSGPQREIYDQLATATRRQLSELAGSKDQKKARMVMLTALLRLRQAACDVRLLGLEQTPEPADCSGKMSVLEELLAEVAEGGHRVLVFSQFVTMLGNIRQELDAGGVDYCYLDGQSRDRALQVQRFQAGQALAFLISLKAGGTGLNLTAADTVIHFDPWWNPAVEAQATDRAHRIGQTKVVTSYKLIARGTVEEKILALQERKKAVIAATLASEQPMMEGLTLDEIQELLE